MILSLFIFTNVIIKNTLSILSINFLIPISSISSEFRQFCGFFKIPHRSNLSKFKSTSIDNLNNLFKNLVDFTEEITDTIKFEAYVTENNLKVYQSQLKISKSHSKFFANTNPNLAFNVEKYAQVQIS